MPVATFDTLKYANALKASGMPDKQAEIQAEVLSEALQVNFKELATKDDIKALDEKINHLRDLFKWMIGVVITINVGILIRLFLVH